MEQGKTYDILEHQKMDKDDLIEIKSNRLDIQPEWREYAHKQAKEA